jgi:class 3 adenylate cyclase/pimeloyl-ACP methyl ester carboxylesterase
MRVRQRVTERPMFHHALAVHRSVTAGGTTYVVIGRPLLTCLDVPTLAVVTHSTQLIPETRYAKSGGVHIAYRVHGEGPFDIVLVPPWFWSVDTFGCEPEDWQALTDLSSVGRVIVFDKRGTGSSDPIVGAPTLEDRMEDLRAVMDAVGSSCAAVFGVADGGAMAALFAATYPERVFALALLLAMPRIAWAPDFPWGMRRERYEQITQEMLSRRILGSMSERIRQRAADANEDIDDDRAQRTARLFRVTASPAELAAYRAMNFDLDVRSVLPAIKVPTLVMHSPDLEDESADTFTPGAISTGSMNAAMAEQIQEAELAAVPASSFWLEMGISSLRDFLPRAWARREQRRVEPERVLATVLFTDLVRSTEKAVEFGPRWQQLLREHNAVIRGELARYSGREIDTAGDGFFASGFDGPARAIRCGCAIRETVANLGLGIRVGVHTGECDVVDDKLSGLAVNIGARIAAQAEEGEVLVSGTVKDLVAGSGIAFEPRGEKELKGLGKWPLYAVASDSDEIAGS